MQGGIRARVLAAMDANVAMKDHSEVSNANGLGDDEINMAGDLVAGKIVTMTVVGMDVEVGDAAVSLPGTDVIEERG